MLPFSIDKIVQKEIQEFSFQRLIQQIFLDDWLMKLIALTITLALWFGVTGSRTSANERLEDVSLKLRVSNDMEITNSHVQEVDLVINGDTRKIDQIKKEDLVVSLDLVNIPAGERIADLTPDTVNVELPTGIKLVDIQPGRIPIKLEMVEKREIPVKAITTNEVAEGFEIYGEPAVVPNKVLVRGPASYVNAIDFISTEKIDLNGRDGDFTAQQVPLNISNSKISIVDETSVDVFFKIGEKRIEKLYLVPVKNLEDSKRKEKVILYGPKALLNSLTPDDFQIEQASFGSDDRLALRLILPAELQGKVVVRNENNFQERSYRDASIVR